MHVAFIIIILLNVTLQAITAPVSNQSKSIEASDLLKELQKLESEINPSSVEVQKVLETKETDIMDKSNNKPIKPSNDKKIMNERALDSEELDNQTASGRSKNIDQMRVIEALEELLQAPMISGFVTKEEEKRMIQSGIIALSKAFVWSKFTMEDVINASKSQVDQDSRTFKNLKGSTRKPLTDDEKVLGLENMVKDKVDENNLSLNEMRYLVKGLAAAVGARNNLSKTSTMKLEKTIQKGAYELVEKNEESGSEQLHRLDLMNYKKLSEDSQKKKEQKQNDDVDDLASLMKNLEKIWKRMNKSDVERSTSKKQKYLLKTILANSLALVESMGKQNEKLEYFNKDFLLKRTSVVPTSVAANKSTERQSKNHVNVTLSISSDDDVIAKKKGDMPRDSSTSLDTEMGLSKDIVKQMEEIPEETKYEHGHDSNRIKGEDDDKNQFIEKDIVTVDEEFTRQFKEQKKDLEKSSSTTPRPQTTSKMKDDYDLIKQLDDLFQRNDT